MDQADFCEQCSMIVSYVRSCMSFESSSLIIQYQKTISIYDSLLHLKTLYSFKCFIHIWPHFGWDGVSILNEGTEAQGKQLARRLQVSKKVSGHFNNRNQAPQSPLWNNQWFEVATLIRSQPAAIIVSRDKSIHTTCDDERVWIWNYNRFRVAAYKIFIVEHRNNKDFQSEM